ncbi:unnamed protein product [Pylaiella littoralis]
MEAVEVPRWEMALLAKRGCGFRTELEVFKIWFWVSLRHGFCFPQSGFDFLFPVSFFRFCILFVYFPVFCSGTICNAGVKSHGGGCDAMIPGRQRQLGFSRHILRFSCVLVDVVFSPPTRRNRGETFLLSP